MSPLRAKILSVLAVAAFAVPAAAHSAHVRAEEKRAIAEIEALTGAVEPVTLTAGAERRVTLNGGTTFFRKTTENGSLDEIMARVAKECESPTQSVAFGLSTNLDDGHGAPIQLERVVTQGEGSVRASLCIFKKEGAASGELHRARYTLAHQREDGTVGVTTVVNASGTPLAELFPAEGDAPGSDPPDIARPRDARRTLTAIVGRGEHAVRVYESTMTPEAAVASYDGQMKALGFVTTGSLADARMYRKDGRSYVASFRGTTGGSTVALAPFGGAASD